MKEASKLNSLKIEKRFKNFEEFTVDNISKLLQQAIRTKVEVQVHLISGETYLGVCLHGEFSGYYSIQTDQVTTNPFYIGRLSKSHQLRMPGYI